MVRDDQPDAREGQAGRRGDAEGSADGCYDAYEDALIEAEIERARDAVATAATASQ